ncbi:NUDIX domain-containing protein [Amycolatopsis rhizosphaerae]|uniref:NUDIX domain-containing protein n=1 Tax=Amycolatopsis rhizosphaerae TaxID=2053003 RepID=UPI001C96A3F0|nr:NUDIX hydrolase [Amycolatopsis rhizosphaerae]
MAKWSASSATITPATRPRCIGAAASRHVRSALESPTYKPDWDLSGGTAEANKPPSAAAERELREELGLDIAVGRLLCLDWVLPHGPSDDTLMFVFDGGTLDDEAVAKLRIHDDEIGQLAFVSVSEARTLLRPYVWDRLNRAVQARSTGMAFTVRPTNRAPVRSRATTDSRLVSDRRAVPADARQPLAKRPLHGD